MVWGERLDQSITVDSQCVIDAIAVETEPAIIRKEDVEVAVRQDGDSPGPTVVSVEGGVGIEPKARVLPVEGVHLFARAQTPVERRTCLAVKVVLEGSPIGQIALEGVPDRIRDGGRRLATWMDAPGEIKGGLKARPGALLLRPRQWLPRRRVCHSLPLLPAHATPRTPHATRAVATGGSWPYHTATA